MDIFQEFFLLYNIWRRRVVIKIIAGYSAGLANVYKKVRDKKIKCNFGTRQLYFMASSLRRTLVLYNYIEQFHAKTLRSKAAKFIMLVFCAFVREIAE